jgi:hypothetical protein
MTLRKGTSGALCARGRERCAGDVLHPVKDLPAATTDVSGQKVPLGERYMIVPWMRVSRHDDSEIVVEDWNLADLDDADFSVSGIPNIFPGNNGRRVRHAIELR